MKPRARQLYKDVKAKPEGETYKALLKLIEGLLTETLEGIVKNDDKDELLRLQGQARCLDNMSVNLTRKPVTNPLHNE